MLPARYLPDSARRVLISVNPNAGYWSGTARVNRLQSFLREHKFQVEILSDLGEIADKAARYHETHQLRALVAAGGDGTVALLANHTRAGTPLAVLPLGTENLLSKYLDICLAPERVGQAIAEGLTAPLDAGRAGDRIFLLMVGCGFDAEVVRQLHAVRTGHIHHLSYAKPIINSIRNYQYPELRITCFDPPPEIALENTDLCGERTVVRARWAFAINLPRYAGGLQIVPEADGTDGLLDVCTFKDGSLWNTLRYLFGVASQQHLAWEDCVVRKARRIRIEADEPVPFQTDGDPGGFLPVDIEVLPQRLTMIVTRQWAEKTRFLLPPLPASIRGPISG